MSIKVATILADRILKEIEKGVLPWERGYSAKGLPYNVVTNKDYHGFNAFVLMMASPDGDNRFLGLKQAQKISGKLKAGEFKSGVPIYCPIFKKIEKENGEKDQKLVSFCFRTVYHVSQFTGLNEAKMTNRVAEKQENATIEEMEAFVALQSPTIKNGGQPCYIPALDEIRIPELTSYKSSEHYYCTLLHEIGHWTGAEDRMNRKGIVQFDRFGSDNYGYEELIAEMFAFFARNKLGIEGFENAEIKNRVSYLKGWMDKIKAEPQMLIHAASAAEKALNWYVGETITYQKDKEVAA